MAEQNDLARLYREFEEAFVDVLTAKGELLLSRRTKLYQARTRLRAHKDLKQREYEAAVLRAEARAWESLSLAEGPWVSRTAGLPRRTRSRLRGKTV
jgi:hypothetical protein